MRVLKEKELIAAALAGTALHFVARQNATGFWELEFSYRGRPGYGLQLRRNEIRQFRRLSGVVSLMNRAAIKEFKVIL